VQTFEYKWRALWEYEWRAFHEVLQQNRQKHHLPAASCLPKSWRRTDLLKLLFLAAAIVALIGMDFSVNASEELREDSPQPSAAANAETSSGGGAAEEGATEDISRDYRLAPGDRLTIVVFDQPQLSGELIIDGRGEILLPLTGSVPLSGLTLAEAQDLIQQRFADGVLVQPAVSVRITHYRPIFVTGYVKKPGSYPFTFGESIKAAIATAGGEGQAVEQPLSVAVSDLIMAEERVRQLEGNQATFLVRKARLEAQRDGRENFVIPLLVGLNSQNVELDHIYSAENDVFVRLAGTYRDQVQALQNQRPLIEAEIKAITDQTTKQKEHLEIVDGHLGDLEFLYGKGMLRKELLLNQQIEKTLVQAQLSSLQAEVARLRQTMGELDVKLVDLKAAHERQILEELQQTSQRLREVEMSLAPARKLRGVKAEAAIGESGEAEYGIFISRSRDGGIVTFKATEETALSPGDVVEVKLTRPFANQSSPTEAMENLRLDPASSLAEGAGTASR
jgi:polysaccharide export outer membrane protein